MDEKDEDEDESEDFLVVDRPVLFDKDGNVTCEAKAEVLRALADLFEHADLKGPMTALAKVLAVRLYGPPASEPDEK